METRELFQVHYAITDYREATEVIIQNARNRKSFGMSALAVHGLIESTRNPRLQKILERIDMITPDGQPVRWALNHFYRTGMADRVYGPRLTEWVLQAAATEKLNVYLYGSTPETLECLKVKIHQRFPGVRICGMHVDRFREATPEEDEQDIRKINASGAHIVLVGRGCPRQEIWVGEHIGKVQAVMMAVGAAFDFIAGTKKQAPVWLQNNGLEWFFRLMQEPGRLWKRYLSTNSQFIYLLLKRKLSIMLNADHHTR